MSRVESPEAAVVRDQDVTGFTGHLTALLRQVPEALCAVFVDGEGEAVDLSSRLDAFDARIAGAELAIVMAGAREAAQKLRQGALLELRFEGSARSVIVRHVSEGYDLVVLVESDTISARAAEATAATAVALMAEAKLPPPPSYAVLRSVEYRASRTGIAMPRAFDEGGVRRRIEAVLGHREEGGEMKFLVRLDTGEELLIAREHATGRWQRSG